MLTKCLSYIKKLYSRISGEFTFYVYILSDDTRRVVYIVSTSVDVGTTKYFSEKLCGKDIRMTKIKRIYAWELNKFVNKEDVVFVDMHKLFTRFFDGGIFVPRDVSQVLDIDGSLDEAIKINTKNLRRVYKYNYEVSHDYDKFKFFYEKMYVPYVSKRYGDSAVTHFDDLLKIFRNGELLLIKLGEKYVSAQLSEVINNVYVLRINGVLDESFVKEGALTATYYFSILRAKDINAKIVDFGKSKPFLSDGVLRHKSLWGTRICKDENAKRIIYMKNILFEQPFIYFEDRELKVAIFSEDDKLINEYTRSGLDFKVVSR